MTPKQRRIDELTKWAASKRAAAASLIAQYGTGVRPGWVSCDEALHYEAAARAEAEIKALEPLPDNTARVVTIHSHSVDALRVRVKDEIAWRQRGGLSVLRETFTSVNGVHAATIEFGEAVDVSE